MSTEDPMPSADVFAYAPLLSPDGGGGWLVRESSVQFRRPAIEPVRIEDLTSPVRSVRAEGQTLYRAEFPIKLDELARRKRYEEVCLTVRFSGEEIVPVDLDASGVNGAAPPPWTLRSPFRRPVTQVSATVWGEGRPRFGVTYRDSHGYRSYGMHATLGIPSGIGEVAGTMSVRVEISQTGGRGPRRAATTPKIPFTLSLPDRRGRIDTRPAVRLCLAVDVQGYGRRPNGAASRTQHRLVRVLKTALRTAGVGEGDVDRQEGGDGCFLVFKAGIDETQVIPGLLTGLHDGLRTVNAGLDGGDRLRLRVALYRGLIRPDVLGYVGHASVAVHRLLDSRQLRDALADPHAGDYAIMVAEALYRDVIQHGYGGLSPEAFQRTKVEDKAKEFDEEWCWILTGACAAIGRRV